VGDFNGDGRSDLAAVRDGDTLYIWNGRGDNKFTSAIQIGSGWAPYDNTLMGLGDTNGDGRSDIAAIHRATGVLHIWNGRGDNKFGAATPIGPGWNTYF
jgi:hypothetical protein